MTTDPAPSVPPNIAALRPRDLLVLTFRFEGFQLTEADGGQAARLIPGGSPDAPPLIIVDFPPQAVGEAVLQVTEPPRSAGDLSARYAGQTRLVFVVPPQSDPIEYRVQAILDRCRELPMRTFNGAVLDGTPFDVDPLVTGLQLPYGLVLSPGGNVSWDHATGPTHAGGDGRVELWHTRLVGDATARAIGNPKLLEHLPTALESDDRHRLVRHASDGDAPIEVRALLLSALGAWLDARAAWDDVGDHNPLKSWQHRMTLGRDQFVQVVTAGYLFPFGHRAVVVETTRREVTADRDGTDTAFLRKRLHILVRQRERDYVAGGAPPEDHRELPFKRVRLVTTATPELLPKTTRPVVGAHPEKGFWPQMGDPQQPEDVLFHVVATDRQDNIVEFRLPLAFIHADAAAAAASNRGDALHAWMFSEDASQPSFANEPLRRREARVAGQRVAFADPSSGPPARQGDTAFDTETIELKAKAPTPRPASAPASGLPPFLPALRRATCSVPALREATSSDGRVTMAYHPDYAGGREHPLDAFAKLIEPAPLGFTAEQAGGLTAPSFPITRLSRTLGPLGAAPDNAEGRFDPTVFFGGGGPRLLGVFDLVKLLPALTFTRVDEVFGSGPKLPRLVTMREGTVARTVLQWETPLVDPFAGATLHIEVGRESGERAGLKISATGTLTNFKVTVPVDPEDALVELPLDELSFHTETGRKPDVSVKLGRVLFLNELEFVNTLADVIDSLGFHDPPALNVTGEGVEVGYTLGVPDVAVGVFGLQNLALSAAFALPLLDARSPSLHLAFSERHNPFVVTYTAFGGGGFVGVLLGLGTVQMLEGSIEVAGVAAIDLGVASGGVTVAVGLYFSMTKVGEAFDYALAGYVRCVGVLEVLGLLSISAHFYLELRYEPTSRVSGTASLTVEVEVLFFSESVTLTVHRQFSGSAAATRAAMLLAPAGDRAHTFEDAMSEQAWAEYCRAFERVS